jgi:hypothetical protein
VEKEEFRFAVELRTMLRIQAPHQRADGHNPSRGVTEVLDVAAVRQDKTDKTFPAGLVRFCRVPHVFEDVGFCLVQFFLYFEP